MIKKKTNFETFIEITEKNQKILNALNCIALRNILRNFYIKILKLIDKQFLNHIKKLFEIIKKLKMIINLNFNKYIGLYYEKTFQH